MSGNTIQIYEDTAGEYRWRLVMCGEIVAASSEGYSDKSDCWDAAWSVKSRSVFDALRASLGFETFVDRANELRWRLRHRNGNIIATSGEGYRDPERFVADLMAVVNAARHAEMVDTTADADPAPLATFR